MLNFHLKLIPLLLYALLFYVGVDMSSACLLILIGGNLFIIIMIALLLYSIVHLIFHMYTSKLKRIQNHISKYLQSLILLLISIRVLLLFFFYLGLTALSCRFILHSWRPVADSTILIQFFSYRSFIIIFFFAFAIIHQSKTHYELMFFNHFPLHSSTLPLIHQQYADSHHYSLKQLISFSLILKQDVSIYIN